MGLKDFSPPRLLARRTHPGCHPVPPNRNAAMPRRFLYAITICALLPAASRADVNLPTGGTVKQVDFERHVMGLLSKVGCNAGSCHGSFQAKNGFRTARRPTPGLSSQAASTRR